MDLVWLIFVLVLCGLVLALLNYLPLVAPFDLIAKALVVLVCIVVILNKLGVHIR